MNDEKPEHLAPASLLARASVTGERRKTSTIDIAAMQVTPKKPVLAERLLGTVQWFNVKDGYDFINRNDTREDIFVHQTAITRNDPQKLTRSVYEGQTVEFDVVVVVTPPRPVAALPPPLAVAALPSPPRPVALVPNPLVAGAVGDNDQVDLGDGLFMTAARFNHCVKKSWPKEEVDARLAKTNKHLATYVQDTFTRWKKAQRKKGQEAAAEAEEMALL
ncbi:hypothetical protein ISCGN_002573 [Ixodes scapularis]